jgi:hypothetical protein
LLSTGFPEVLLPLAKLQRWCAHAYDDKEERHRERER